MIAGPQPDLGEAVRAIEAAGLRVKNLPVAGAFHSDLVAAVRGPLAHAAERAVAARPDRPVYSNLDANPYPADPPAIAAQVGEHAVRPVRFAPMVEAMYRDGARIFVEVGPGAVLTGLVGSILGERPHLAVACDSASKPGIPTLLATLARLAVAGVPVRLDRLTEGRSDRRLDLANLPVGDGTPALAATTWLVNGSRSRPIDQPEPKRLGQSAGMLDRPAPTPRPAVPAPARPGHHPAPTGTGTGTGTGNGQVVAPEIPNGTGHHPVGGPSNGKVMNPPSRPASSVPGPTPLTGAPTLAEERVLASFQETMRVFLDVQRSTMLAYLGGRAGAATSPAPVPVAPPSVVAPVVLPAPISERLTARPAPVAVPAATPVPVPVAAPSVVAKVIPEPATTITMGREAVAARLVEIVRDRTGYPAEMLGLDLDLEADLGIDSIKRVEILGTLRESVGVLAAATDPSTMDSLSRAKTLGGIVDRVDEITRRQHTRVTPSPNGKGAHRESRPAGSVAPGSPADGDDPEPAGSSSASSVRRLVIEAVPAPLASFRPEGGIAPGGVVIITDDGRGVGRALAIRFEAEGHPVVLVGPGKFDLGSPASVDLLLAKARARGPIAAIIHANPLRLADPTGLDPDQWAARLTPEVKGLFLLAKGAATDLERASRRGGGP